MNVLVVESEDRLREPLVSWVREAGFDVLTCPGPQGPDFDCAGASRSGCPLGESADVVVLDLELESDLLMCGVAAWELLHYYRSLDKPVVVLSGIDDAIRPLPGDRIAVLRRPPEREALVEAIELLLLVKERRPTPHPESVPDVLAPAGRVPAAWPVEPRKSPADARIGGVQMATNVREVMISSIPTVTVDASLREVAEILAKRSGSAVLVVAEDGEVFGIVTEAVLASALSRIVEATEARRPMTEASLRPASRAAGRRRMSGWRSPIGGGSFVPRPEGRPLPVFQVEADGLPRG